MRERLDRVVANEEWMVRFPLHRVINGELRHSNHRSVIVVTNPPTWEWRRGGPPIFRFEAGWVEEEQCATIVGNAWKLSMEARGVGVMDTIRNVAVDLEDWSWNVLGDLEKRIKKARKLLEDCRRREINASNVRKEELVRFKLERPEEKRNLYRRQGVQVHWLEKGDRVHAFFTNMLLNANKEAEFKG